MNADCKLIFIYRYRMFSAGYFNAKILWVLAPPFSIGIWPKIINFLQSVKLSFAVEN
jgi:hypothetical protein